MSRLAPVFAALLAVVSCAAPDDADRTEAALTSTDPAVSLYAVVDLPRTALTEGLSGTTFDEATSTLFALSDVAPRIVPLHASADYRSWTVGEPIALTGRKTYEWDGEGLALVDGDFYAVTIETRPLVERFDAGGARLGVVSMPSRFSAQHPGNKGLESLAVDPSGRHLFTANEAALTYDGDVASKAQGTVVRILRKDLETNEQSEFAYLTEPLGEGGPGDMGVSELVALSADELLVLERGFQHGYGNTVRVFRVSLGGAIDVANTSSIAGAVVPKTLFVDLAELPSAGVTHPSTQPNPLLDNYESLSLGPRLEDGRRLVFVTSDDNQSAGQVARILVLAARDL